MNEIITLSVHELTEKLRAREVSSEEATKAYLGRIEETDERVHAYLCVLEEEALAAAREADKCLAGGDDNASPLLGVPVAVKDLLCMKGTPTTCASKFLENFIAPYDATAIRLLKESGAVILGKVNMDEFAMGSSTEHSAYGPSRNPWNLETIPGGSSGGSAATVAARSCAASLGSDTGGSIRQPAACCGVVGMKPTYGRVSRYGLIAFASSLDQIGPFTRDIRDCAIMLNAISGHDPLDSTSANESVPDFTEELGAGTKGLRIGIPKEYFIEGMDPDVETAVREAIRVMEESGAEIHEISLPHSQYALPVYYIIASAEASSNLARYDGVRYGTSRKWKFGRIRPPSTECTRRAAKRVSARRSSGASCSAPTPSRRATTTPTTPRRKKCARSSARNSKMFSRKWTSFMSATAPTPAFRFGERMDDPISMYLSDILTIPCNLAGLPGISQPCGVTSADLPIGLQILGKPFGETTVLRTAAAFEEATSHHLALPPL